MNDKNMVYIPNMRYALNGAISGAVGIACSHPFDTIKTHMQNHTTVPHSIRALYRGIFPAMVGVGFEKAIVFGVYENMRRITGSVDKKCANNDKGTGPIGNGHMVLAPVGTAISGGVSGLAASLIVTPVDRLKILLQTNKTKKITFSDICPRTLYGGISATFTREVPGFAIYFSVYEYLKYEYIRRSAISDMDIPLYVSFVFGGLSGAVAWCGIYPQDVVKTRMQTLTNITPNITTNATKTRVQSYGFLHTLRCVAAEGGLYRGFHFALMRAIPLHAGTFMTFEALKHIQNNEIPW